MKWQHYVYYIEKMKMWTQKNVKVVSKKKGKSKASSNEEFINEVHWNFPYISFLKVLNDVIVINFYFWESISHLKI